MIYNTTQMKEALECKYFTTTGGCSHPNNTSFQTDTHTMVINQPISCGVARRPTLKPKCSGFEEKISPTTESIKYE